MYKLNLKQKLQVVEKKAFDGKCFNEYKFIYFSPPYLLKKLGCPF